MKDIIAATVILTNIEIFTSILKNGSTIIINAGSNAIIFILKVSVS